MKIVLLCGKQPNQIALACKIAKEFNLAGVIFESKKHKSIYKYSFTQLFNKILDRTLFVKILNSWFNLMNYYTTNFPDLPEVENITISNINSDETVMFITKLQPDLVIVSGTSIIKNEILKLNIPKGIINLHTGLSPYVKGGPNCTNWCIANNDIHLIGNTVMWIDEGIDSGDIIATETTKFDGYENLNQIHIKVMEHAHELYLKCLRQIQINYEKTSRVKQNTITEGKTYYTKEWTFKPKFKMLLNLHRFKETINSEKYREAIIQVKTIKPEKGN